MIKEIHYLHLEENNIQIAYDEDQKTLWLTPEGGDLNDFAEFIEMLCPEFDIETLSIEEGLTLQKSLYHALWNEVRQTIILEIVKFFEGMKQRH